MAPNAAPRQSRTYDTFGWQGIALTVPAHWQMVYTQGDRKAGYVRLADEEQPRLELRWETLKKTQPPGDAVDVYVAKLQKTARREDRELTVRRNLGLASPPGKDVECYRWVGEQQAVAMLSRCQDCHRTVHVHVLGEPEESLKSLARTVFASLRDHPVDGREVWRFFDVEFSVPEGLVLKRRDLKAGGVRMKFAGKSCVVEFVRVSLAQVVLERTGLEEWFRDFYAAFLKWRLCEVEQAQVKGHPGLRLRGRARLAVNPLRIVGRRRVVRAACWHCEPTNRLMICSFDGLERRANFFEEALESFRCCAGE